MIRKFSILMLLVQKKNKKVWLFWGDEINWKFIDLIAPPLPPPIHRTSIPLSFTLYLNFIRYDGKCKRRVFVMEKTTKTIVHVSKYYTPPQPKFQVLNQVFLFIFNVCVCMCSISSNFSINLLCSIFTSSSIYFCLFILSVLQAWKIFSTFLTDCVCSWQKSVHFHCTSICDDKCVANQLSYSLSRYMYAYICMWWRLCKKIFMYVEMPERYGCVYILYRYRVCIYKVWWWILCFYINNFPLSLFLAHTLLLLLLNAFIA